MLSRVLSLTVIHLTKANEVNEKTKVMHAAATIDGNNNGAQRFLILEALVLPCGNKRNCSSKSGSSLDRRGSQKRIIKAILNQAWDIISVHHQVPSLVLKSSPWDPTRVSIPMAAIIDGMTKGNVRTVLIRDSKGHLWRPRVQAIGILIISVRMVDENDCNRVNSNTFCEI